MKKKQRKERADQLNGFKKEKRPRNNRQQHFGTNHRYFLFKIFIIDFSAIFTALADERKLATK